MKFKYYLRTEYPAKGNSFQMTQSSKRYITDYDDYVELELSIYADRLRHMECDEVKIEEAIKTMRAAYSTANVE